MKNILAGLIVTMNSESLEKGLHLNITITEISRIGVFCRVKQFKT